MAINTLFRTVFLLGVIGISTPVVCAEGSDSSIELQDDLNLPNLIKMATKRNPGLKAARHRWKAAIEQYPQAKALPDPSISYVYFDEAVETKVGPQEHRMGISQAFPFPGTLKAKGTIALKGIKIAEINHERALRDLIVDVKISFYERAYLERAIGVTEQNHALMQNAAKLAATLYAKNEATLNDLLKAQAQDAQLKYDLILLRELLSVETTQLMVLLDLPDDTKLANCTLPAMRKLTAPYAAIEKQALSNRQELKLAAAKVAQADAGLSLAYRKRLPSFNVSAATIVTDDAENPAVTDSGKDPIMYGLSMTLPLNFSKNSAITEEAKQRKAAAAEDAKAMTNMTRAMVKKTYFKLQNSKRLVALYEKSLIPQAKKAMDVSETWQVDGKKDVASFLETQSVWLNFNLARLRAVTDYHQNLAKLERLAGGTIKAPKPEKGVEK